MGLIQDLLACNRTLDRPKYWGDEQSRHQSQGVFSGNLDYAFICHDCRCNPIDHCALHERLHGQKDQCRKPIRTMHRRSLCHLLCSRYLLWNILGDRLILERCLYKQRIDPRREWSTYSIELHLDLLLLLPHLPDHRNTFLLFLLILRVPLSGCLVR